MDGHSPPGAGHSSGSCWFLGPQRTLVLHLDLLLQWAPPKQQQSRPDPHCAYRAMSSLPPLSPALPPRSHPRRASQELLLILPWDSSIRAVLLPCHPCCSHVTPPHLSHARSCPGLATTVAPGDTWGQSELLSPGCFPSWSSKQTSFPKAVQMWDVELPLKYRYSHHTHTVYFLNHQVKIQTWKWYPRVATPHASHVPWILKGSAFRPVSTPPQCNTHFYQGSCLMAPINFDF